MKEQIVESVKKFIRVKGFQFTIADIVKDVRISKNTFYQHFESKEEIILHIINEMKAESDEKQIELLNDVSVPPYEKLKKLLVILPSDYDLINPITINQLKTSFPKTYEIIDEIYHRDWERFETLYDDCVNQGIVGAMDVTFFKELYILGISHLPTVSGMGKYNHKELLTKLVNQLFTGVPYLS